MSICIRGDECRVWVLDMEKLVMDGEFVGIGYGKIGDGW